jgi:GR25 family glycosyltransferase involved in LPS biosynthesis
MDSTNCRSEFVDGVLGNDFDHKAMPPIHKDDLSAGVIGCWAAHVKTLQKVVQRNLSSALVIEADSDWDLRFKSQLQELAISTNALLEAEKHGVAGDMPFHSLPPTVRPPTNSPYGDGWDLLWIGHCEMNMWEDGPRVIRSDDPTTVAKQHLWTWEGEKQGDLEPYSEHTRAVFPTSGGVCTFGYAVSRQGAQKLLYHLSLNDLTDPIDVTMRKFCRGEMAGDAPGLQSSRKCFGVLPALISTHMGAGDPASRSDINDFHGDFNEKGYTPSIRHSAMLNLRNMVDGGEIEDQFPDDG